jgi:hypothetical protein
VKRLAASVLLPALVGCAVQSVHDAPTQKHTLKIAPHEYAPLGPTDGPIVVEESWYVQGTAARYTGKRAALPAD